MYVWKKLIDPINLGDLNIFFILICRLDDKTTKDSNVAAGAALHLVLALRGGGKSWSDSSEVPGSIHSALLTP